MKHLLAVAAVAVTVAASGAAAAGHKERRHDERPLSARALTEEIDRFLAREVAAHFAAIPTLDPPPDRVLGAKTVGEFSWGTFMRALAATATRAHAPSMGGRQVAPWIGRMGLIEARAGSKAFSQMYSALALQQFGERLDANPVWLGLSPGEQQEWRSLLDVKRFYDPAARRVIELPENYLGVAARTAAIGYRLGISTDRAPLDALVDRAAQPFGGGRRYFDDAPPTGRFDRYSNEYARYVWDAASQANRSDILALLRPSLTSQMKLWWDLVDGDDGYGYPWGRSLGIVSYLDTLEIVAFLSRYAEFRPAPIADLVALYARSWNYLRHDYRDDRHLLSLFEFGRGNYAYINLDREWQQTTGFFGKAQAANATLAESMGRELVTTYPARAALGPVARVEFFRESGDRRAAVWLVRQGPLHFALPITTGTRPGVADYLPAPHGLAGFAAPVEQDVPALVPYLELDDGRTIVAADSADEIGTPAGGREFQATWRRWAQLGATAGQLVDPGVTSQVRWTLGDDTLSRRETLTAARSITIRRWRVVVPTTASLVEESAGGMSLNGDCQSLAVSVSAPWPIERRLRATGDTPAGRGARRHIPLHVSYESHDIHLSAGQALSWQMTLRVKEEGP